jgi:hypothetical protein
VRTFDFVIFTFPQNILHLESREAERKVLEKKILFLLTLIFIRENAQLFALSISHSLAT